MVKNKSLGFTILEMTMVTGVVALVAIGVVVGKDLLEVSKLNNMASKIQSFEAARATFAQKYRCLPGDCPLVKDYGFAEYGNGNGRITDTSGNTFFNGEIENYWQHLKTAALINDNVEEYGIPSLEYKGAHISLGYNISSRKNTYILGVDPEATGPKNRTISQFLLPSEIAHIDAKIDDGLPESGNMNGTIETTVAAILNPPQSSSGGSSSGGGSSSSGGRDSVGRTFGSMASDGQGVSMDGRGAGSTMDSSVRLDDHVACQTDCSPQPTNHCYDESSSTYLTDYNKESCAGTFAFMKGV